ncbi:MAG: hypothetical protein ACPG6B_08060 [Oceanihabitans sp.]
MATKTKKATKKATKSASVINKINTELVNASIATINTVVDNGEKWQKLASKLIKKSEKVREQQINMIFDTAEAVKGQFLTGTDKMKDLVGYDAEVVEKAKDLAINNPVSRKVVGIVEDITEKVTENPMVQKAEKATEDIKNMGIAKFNEIKEDVLEQASKIIDKGEAIIEDAKAPKATKKVVAAKKTVAKKATATKAKATKKVAKKATATKTTAKKVVKKAAPKAKTTVAKKATAVKTTATKTANKTVAKVAEVKKEVATKVAAVKTEVKK